MRRIEAKGLKRLGRVDSFTFTYVRHVQHRKRYEGPTVKQTQFHRFRRYQDPTNPNMCEENVGVDVIPPHYDPCHSISKDDAVWDIYQLAGKGSGSVLRHLFARKAGMAHRKVGYGTI